jgi:hypothetical protein
MMLHYQKRTIIAQSRLLVIPNDEHEAVADLWEALNPPLMEREKKDIVRISG